MALTLARAGYSVVVLGKGPWFLEQDLCKDELTGCRRWIYTSDPRHEPQMVETEDDQGGWWESSTYRSAWTFWNGNCVGGSSNFMNGYFHRLKPIDFRLRELFGPVAGADPVDCPIIYEDLEPCYARVEEEVGVSGRVTPHPYLEPRSRPDFPFLPLAEHPLAGLVDQAVATGRCEIRPHAMVSWLVSDPSGWLTGVEYYDRGGRRQRLDAGIYVVACQAIESARLQLGSVGLRHPRGLANGSGQVGRNLLFAGGVAASGRLVYTRLPEAQAAALEDSRTFINRALQDWYRIDDPEFGLPAKVGTIDFVHRHPAPIARAHDQAQGPDGLRWGLPLKRRLESHFRDGIRGFLRLDADRRLLRPS